MININCPSCSTDLQIDDGFRGGVCRCFDCGTLMTVPDDPGSQNPEPLIRQGGGKSESRSRRPAAPKLKGKGKGKAPAPAPAASVQAGAYQTASGKEIQISEEQANKIPTAARRKVVRWATRIGVVLLCVALLAGVGIGAYFAFTTGKFAKKVEKKVTVEEATKGVIYDNFFENPDPNFMGLKVSDKTVFCIDASKAIGDQEIGHVTDAVRAASQVLSESQQLQAIFWKDTGPVAYPDNLTAAAHIDQKDMKKTLYDITANGTQKPIPALAMAKKSGADQIIVVVGQRINETLVNEIIDNLSDWGKSVSIVVVTGSFVSSDDKALHAKLEEKAKSSQGEFRTIPGSDLGIWIKSWKDKTESDEK